MPNTADGTHTLAITNAVLLRAANQPISDPNTPSVRPHH